MCVVFVVNVSLIVYFGRMMYFWQYFVWNIQYFQYFVVLVQGMDVEQYGMRGVGVIGYMDMVLSYFLDKLCINCIKQ